MHMLFLLPLVASCSGLGKLTVYNMDMDHPSTSKQEPVMDHERTNKTEQLMDAYMRKADEYADQHAKEYSFNKINRKRWEGYYTSLVLDFEDIGNIGILISDLYNYILQHDKLPFLGPEGKPAAKKAQEIWQQGKQVFGNEEEIFRKDPEGLFLIHKSFRKIPEAYKQKCLKMISEVIDSLLQSKLDKKKLYERLTHFEQSFNKEVYPHYNEEMTYLKILLLKYFNTIDQDTFYSDFYSNFTSYLQTIHVLLPLVVCSGSDAIKDDFFNFLKKKDRSIDLKDYIT
ncbi:hypothetical protein [Cardinium endosymbiont of Nabis limbatus]|uniref:hypothetical protein n=1 Tax=Cardinium endosymbiont of Nabis limbatus TaxID=3066217 RepID=UPI003AF3C6E9